jgi:hypothetical protein
MKKHIATVKEVLNVYSSLGFQGLVIYFNNPELIVYEDSWTYKIKNLIDKKMWKSTSMEIEFLITKFKNYDEKNDNEKSN